MNLTITNIRQLKLHGAVLPTRVVCNSHVGLTFYNISKLSIDGLAFVACARSIVVQVHYPEKTYYGLHFQSVPTAEIIDCTFQDSYGSALGVVDSRVVLRDNNFLNNCLLCSNGSCDGYLGQRCFGGGVFVQRSNCSITSSSSFFVNSATDGGGVCAWDSSNVYFSGNTTFIDNSASYGGGVSAFSSSNVYISGNTTFSGNSARRDGGGVSAQVGSNINISGKTTFIDNSASHYGGGVRARDRSNVYISGNTTFSDNSASCGGGLSAGSSNVDISGNTTFIGNSASKYGGGVSAGNSNVNISGTPISLVTQLGMTVEESEQPVAMYTSMGTPLSVVTQLGTVKVEE